MISLLKEVFYNNLKKYYSSKAWHLRLDSHENLANIFNVIVSIAYISSNKDKLFNAPHTYLNFLLVPRLFP